MKGGTVKRQQYMKVLENQAAMVFNTRAISRVKAGVLAVEALSADVARDVAAAIQKALKHHRRRMGLNGKYKPHQGAQECARRVRQRGGSMRMAGYGSYEQAVGRMDRK